VRGLGACKQGASALLNSDLAVVCVSGARRGGMAFLLGTTRIYTLLLATIAAAGMALATTLICCVVKAHLQGARRRRRYMPCLSQLPHLLSFPPFSSCLVPSRLPFITTIAFLFCCIPLPFAFFTAMSLSPQGGSIHEWHLRGGYHKE
jgi:hypothetical protein